MSKLTALITTLVLGSSSVALAAPRPEYGPYPRTSVRDRGPAFAPDRVLRARPQLDRRYDDRRYDDRRYDGDRRRGDDFGPRRYRAAWVPLSQPLELARGRDALEVDQRGTFTQLRLQTASGRSYVDRVVIEFRDGSRQVAIVDRELDARDRMVEVLLDGNNRQIDRIVVLGDASRRGAIQVFGI